MCHWLRSVPRKSLPHVSSKQFSDLISEPITSIQFPEIEFSILWSGLIVNWYFICVHPTDRRLVRASSVRHGARRRETQRKRGAARLDSKGSGLGRHVSNATGTVRRAAPKCCGLTGSGWLRVQGSCGIVQLAWLPDSPFLDIPSWLLAKGVWGHDHVWLPPQLGSLVRACYSPEASFTRVPSFVF